MISNLPEKEFMLATFLLITSALFVLMPEPRTISMGAAAGRRARRYVSERGEKTLTWTMEH